MTPIFYLYFKKKKNFPVCGYCNGTTIFNAFTFIPKKALKRTKYKNIAYVYKKTLYIYRNIFNKSMCSSLHLAENNKFQCLFLFIQLYPTLLEQFKLIYSYYSHNHILYIIGFYLSCINNNNNNYDNSRKLILYINNLFYKNEFKSFEIFKRVINDLNSIMVQPIPIYYKEKNLNENELNNTKLIFDEKKNFYIKYNYQWYKIYENMFHLIEFKDIDVFKCCITSPKIINFKIKTN